MNILNSVWIPLLAPLQKMKFLDPLPLFRKICILLVTKSDSLFTEHKTRLSRRLFPFIMPSTRNILLVNGVQRLTWQSFLFLPLFLCALDKIGSLGDIRNFSRLQFAVVSYQIDASCSCVSPFIDHEFRRNIVKPAVDPRGDSRVDPQTTLTLFLSAHWQWKLVNERAKISAVVKKHRIAHISIFWNPDLNCVYALSWSKPFKRRWRVKKLILHKGRIPQANFRSVTVSEILGRPRNTQSCDVGFTRVDSPGSFTCISIQENFHATRARGSIIHWRTGYHVWNNFKVA